MEMILESADFKLIAVHLRNLFYFLNAIFFLMIVDSLGYRTPTSKTNKRTRPFVPVAQSNLTFIKPLKAGKFLISLKSMKN